MPPGTRKPPVLAACPGKAGRLAQLSCQLQKLTPPLLQWHRVGTLCAHPQSQVGGAVDSGINGVPCPEGGSAGVVYRENRIGSKSSHMFPRTGVFGSSEKSRLKASRPFTRAAACPWSHGAWQAAGPPLSEAARGRRHRSLSRVWGHPPSALPRRILRILPSSVRCLVRCPGENAGNRNVRKSGECCTIFMVF